MSKSWKDHLLSSGLPLEYSVIQELKKHDMHVISEYVYERPNELGIPTQFSVDIHANIMGYVWLEFFIECKYRHDSTNWVFTPDEYVSLKDEEFRDTFLIFDNLSKQSINRKVVDGYGFRFSICGKGIELIANTSNPKSIEQAIQQLRYGLANASVNAVQFQLDALSEDKQIFIHIPIVVTTAKLWRIREDVDLDTIRKAKELNDVADSKRYIIVKQYPDNHLTRYSYSILDSEFDEGQRHKFEQLARGPYKSFKHFASTFSTYHPSQFFIVNFNEFGSLVGILIEMFQNENIRKK